MLLKTALLHTQQHVHHSGGAGRAEGTQSSSFYLALGPYSRTGAIRLQPFVCLLLLIDTEEFGASWGVSM